MSTNSTTKSGFDFEEIVQEVNERNLRKSNIIIYGIPEQECSISSSDRCNLDKSKISEVLHHLIPNITVDTAKPIRLGKFDATKELPRPLKIKLQGESQVFRLLSKSKVLRENPHYSSIRSF
ncbi:unnamed protein product [Brassicogethes aeneus]|uniref:Uncharacterized protein n=1 Tax=Brassicogethes aeneus TaxID=1431903 RepID=A0A9P0FK79_BRAAE|nr:unnamed protein product [Brassicogethes aeneus]